MRLAAIEAHPTINYITPHIMSWIIITLISNYIVTSTGCIQLLLYFCYSV